MILSWIKQTSKRLFLLLKQITGKLFKKPGASASAVLDSNLDHKLLSSLRKHFWPRYAQFKYITKFLSLNEKRLLLIASLSMLVVLAGSVTYFIWQHLVIVARAGGEYTEAIVESQPKYINPLFSSASDIDQDLTYLIYNGLFKYQNGQNLVTDLADKYTLSSDEKTYEVTLKPNLRWSDNEPVTADDILFTWEMIQNPEVDSPLYNSFAGVKIEKINNLTVRFILKQPFAPFLSSLTVGLLPEHIWSNLPPTNFKLANNNLNPIGTGIYKFFKLTKDNLGRIQTYTLTRNENSAGLTPYINKLNFKFYTNYQEAIDALRSQAVDAISFAPTNLTDQFSSKYIQFYNFRLPQYTALFFNLNSNFALKDAGLRVALAQAINKHEIADKTLNGSGIAITGPILPGQLGFNNAIKNIFNPQKSKSYLNKDWSKIEPENYFKLQFSALQKNYQTELAALKAASSSAQQISAEEERLNQQITKTVRDGMDSTQPFYQKNKDNKILSLTITTVDKPEYIAVAKAVAAAWMQIGVKTTINPISNRQISRDALKNHNYQVLLYGEITGLDSDLFSFWHSSQIEYPGLNLSLYSNRDVDKLLEDGRSTNDPGKRAQNYLKFQTIIADEAPAIYLYKPLHTIAINRGIKGVNLASGVTPADRYENINQWYRETKWQWK